MLIWVRLGRIRIYCFLPLIPLINSWANRNNWNKNFKILIFLFIYLIFTDTSSILGVGYIMVVQPMPLKHYERKTNRLQSSIISSKKYGSLPYSLLDLCVAPSLLINVQTLLRKNKKVFLIFEA